MCFGDKAADLNHFDNWKVYLKLLQDPGRRYRESEGGQACSGKSLEDLESGFQSELCPE